MRATANAASAREPAVERLGGLTLHEAAKGPREEAQLDPQHDLRLRDHDLAVGAGQREAQRVNFPAAQDLTLRVRLSLPSSYASMASRGT